MANYFKYLADDFTFADTLSVYGNQIVSVSDAFTFADTLSTYGTQFPSLADDFTLADALAVVGDDQVSLADDFTLADTLTNSIIADDQLADDFTFADTIGVNGVYSKSLSDAFTFADTLTLYAKLYPSVYDDFTFADALAVVGDDQVSLADDFTLADTLTNSIIADDQLADDFTFADTDPVANPAYYQSLADDFTFADAVPVDTFGYINTENKRRSVLQCIPGLNVYPSPSGIVNKPDKEHVTWLYRGISPLANISPSLTDDFTFDDTATLLAIFNHSLTDAFTLADILAVVGDDQVSVAEIFTFDDTLTVLGDIQISLVDDFTLADVLLDNLPSLAEIFTFDDTLTNSIIADDQLADDFTFADAVQHNLPILTDDFTFADALSVYIKMYTFPTDDFTLADVTSSFISDYYISDMVNFFALLVNELNQADHEPFEFTRLLLVQFLNRAQDYVVSLLDRKLLRNLDVTATSQALDSDGTFDYSSLTYSIFQNGAGIDGIRLTGGAFCHKITYSEYKGRVDANVTFSTNSPVFYIRDNYIYVKPALDGDGNTQSIDIFYMREPNKMVQTFEPLTEHNYTDCDFTNSKIRTAITEMSLFYAFQFGNRKERAEFAFKRAISGIKDLNLSISGVEV